MRQVSGRKEDQSAEVTTRASTESRTFRSVRRFETVRVPSGLALPSVFVRRVRQLILGKQPSVNLGNEKGEDPSGKCTGGEKERHGRRRQRERCGASGHGTVV